MKRDIGATSTATLRGATLRAGLWMSALLAFAPLAQAQSAAAAKDKPDLAKAKQTAEQVCAACHGADGNSAASANPNLAGQGAEYITRQLLHFKSGVRVNAIMQSMVAALSDADMKALGAYYAQQKPKVLGAKDAALAKTGQRLYRAGDVATGLPACSSCHSPDGAGIPKNYPRLVRPIRRLHLRAAEGIQGRRTRQRRGRQGRAGEDHVGSRATTERQPDEGRGRLHGRAALTASAPQAHG